jgi:hypothetical protein
MTKRGQRFYHFGSLVTRPMRPNGDIVHRVLMPWIMDVASEAFPYPWGEPLEPGDDGLVS